MADSNGHLLQYCCGMTIPIAMASGMAETDVESWLALSPLLVMRREDNRARFWQILLLQWNASSRCPSLKGFNTCETNT